MVEYRDMVMGDIKKGMRLCREAGWNQVERDWQIFLQLSPAGCRVAVSENDVVGTVTTVSYRHSFGWIGMVLVDREKQRQGIGKKLLEEALYILREEETVKLDATPAGRDVYLKLDFADEYNLTRMRTLVDGTGLEVSTARLMHKNDLPGLMSLDEEVFGARRQPLLQWMWEGAPLYCFVFEDQGGLQGYSLARKGSNFTHIGPVISQNIHIAKSLVSATLQHCIGQPVILDAMHFEPEWMAWLKKLGFTEQRLLTRMYRGTNRYRGVPEKQFAILGPEFG